MEIKIIFVKAYETLCNEAFEALLVTKYFDNKLKIWKNVTITTSQL
jgi:hypothetical protein